MKSLAVLALAAAASVPSAWAGPDIGVSIGISQPGVYGRIDIGRYPAPRVVYPRPLVIAPPAVAVVRPPVYMYVPPVYQRDWRHYCGRYSACDRPVYFVREDWVREQYYRRPPPPPPAWVRPGPPRGPGWHDRRDWRDDRRDWLADRRDWRDDRRDWRDDRRDRRDDRRDWRDR